VSPASKSICQITNLEFGKTVSVNINIIKPETDAENFNSIFISYKHLDKYFKLDKSKEYEIFGNIWFHEDKLKSTTTRFKDISYEVWDQDYYPDDYDYNPGDPAPYYVKKEFGEGQIVLTLKEIIE
jgi:hypothetical protein